MTRRKYVVYYGDVPVYSFVTTTRNLEDCINLMLERYDTSVKSFSMYQSNNGVNELVWSTIIPRRGRDKRKVKDCFTGIIYTDAMDCANKSGFSETTIRLHVSNNRKYPRFRYV